MRIGFLLIIALILLPKPGFSQELTAAEKFRATAAFGNLLSVFKETQINAFSDQPAEIYRIFIAPTFYHPLSIRVEKRGNDYFLIAKRLSGQGGYGWGTVKDEKRRRLNKKEWQTLLKLINEASFWTLPVEEPEAEPNERGEVTVCLDSTNWTMEALKTGNYHVVYRYCPDLPGVKTIGLYMVKLTKWPIKEINFR